MCWPNPSILYPHETPVWIVEVKGISRPAGIAAANAANPYRYAMSDDRRQDRRGDNSRRRAIPGTDAWNVGSRRS